MDKTVSTAQSLWLCGLKRRPESRKRRIARAVRLIWNREPRPAELDQSLAYLDTMEKYHRENPPERKDLPTRIQRTMFEEMTGEAFEYDEHLDVYEDYVADKKPWDVEPETRALADLCRVMFNANEFIYLY